MAQERKCEGGLDETDTDTLSGAPLQRGLELSERVQSSEGSF